MANFPQSSDLRPVAPVIDTLAQAYINTEPYIAGDVLPTTPTSGMKAGTYFTINQETFFGDPDQDFERAPKSDYAMWEGPQLGSGTFTCRERGEIGTVDHAQEEESDLPAKFSLRAITLAGLYERQLIAREVRTAALMFTTGNWTNNVTLTGVNQWSDDSSDPLGRIQTAWNTVRGYGVAPNTVIMGQGTMNTLRNHPALLGYLGHHGPHHLLDANAFAGILAQHFGIPAGRVFIGGAVRNTVSSGQTVTMGDVWGDNFWIGYLAPKGGVVARSGVGLPITAAARMSQYDWISEQWDDPLRRQTLMRKRAAETEVVTQALLGYLIYDVAA